MSTIYQDTHVLKFLKIAELWGIESNTDMWTIARKMAAGAKGYGDNNAQPLLIHHTSMVDNEGNLKNNGGFKNGNTIIAINTLIENKPDHAVNIVIQGLDDICITKQNFRKWRIEKYPLPKFWFTEEERVFSQQESVQIERIGRIKPNKNWLSFLDGVIDENIKVAWFNINLKALWNCIKKNRDQK